MWEHRPAALLICESISIGNEELDRATIIAAATEEGHSRSRTRQKEREDWRERGE